MANLKITVTEYGYRIEEKKLGSSKYELVGKSLFKNGRNIILTQESPAEMIITSDTPVQLDRLEIPEITNVVLENITGSINELITPDTRQLKIRNLNGTKDQLEINKLTGNATVLIPMNVRLGFVDLPLKKLTVNDTIFTPIPEKSNILICDGLKDFQNEYLVIALKRKEGDGFFISQRDSTREGSHFHPFQTDNIMNEKKFAEVAAKYLTKDNLENDNTLRQFKNSLSKLNFQ
jgi:hypothetical protein